MKAFPILLDTRPCYLEGAAAATSLLLAPLGATSMLRFLSERLASLGHPRLSIATDFAPDDDYRRQVERSGVSVSEILPTHELQARIAEYEPSDWLILLDPRCVPARGLAAAALRLEGDEGPRRVRHLVALEAHPGGTTERVHLGRNGSVGRIQRYYDSATWPFTSGVACSLVPVSCTMGASELPFGSLKDLRQCLAERGVPSLDVFLRGGAFDLSQERDLLALSERRVLDYFSGRGEKDGWLAVGSGCRVDPSARLVGPVVLHDGAEIGADASVVGPAVIGPGAKVGRGAVIAQCVLGPDSVVAADLTLCHRAVFGANSDSGPAPLPPYEPLPVATEEAGAGLEQQRSTATYASLKAAFDVAASALGLLLLSPLLALIALLVRLESDGPVLYADRREGRGGRVFRCLKFRTMVTGADAQQRELMAKNQVDGPQFKMDRDPRITKLGRVLRALNLDELPQLLNVLRLEMSLVGPRPSPFRENQMCVPWRDGRLSVRPGITGLWQVCRHDRAQGDFHQWIQFDLLYVRHMSFAVDLKILAATVVSLAGKRAVPLSWIISPRLPEGAA